MPAIRPLSYLRGRAQLLDCAQAGALLGYPRRHVYEMAQRGDLGPVYRIGASLRLDVAHVRHWLAANPPRVTPGPGEVLNG